MVCRRRVSFCLFAAALLALATLATLPAKAAVTTYTSTFSGTIAAGDTALLTGTASVAGNVANSGTLQFNVSGSSAVANNAIISGTGLVRMTGSGTVSNLFDAQTYTGATRLENGTLLVNYNDRLGNTSSGVTFDGGRLQITNSGVVSTFSTARSMSLLSAGTIDTSTLADGSYDQPAFTGVVSGTGTLTLAAHGLGNGASDAYLRFGGASTYTGTTRITSGMVYASSTAAFGTSTVVLDGGGLVAPSAVTVNNAIFLAGTANFVRPWSSQTMNLGGAISGTGGLQKTDNGTVNLNAANTYTGDTRILAGTLNAANYAALATTILDMKSGDTGSIGFTVAQTGTYQIAGLTGSRAINNGGDTLAIGGNDASTTYSGTLSGAGGLIKAGTGTLTLTGSNAYTGGTQLQAGTLALGSAGAIGSSGTISFTGGTLQYSASNTTDYSSRFSTAAGQDYSIDTNGQNVTFANPLNSSGGSLTKLGAGVLNLTGTTAASNTVVLDFTTNVSGGGLRAVGGGAALRIGNSGTGTLNVTGGEVTNSNGFLGYNASGVGTATVSSGTWANSGDLTVGLAGAGTLNVTGGSVTNTRGFLGSQPGSIGTATVSGGTWANSRNLTVGDSGTGTLTMSGGLVTVGGTLSRGTNGTINLNAGGTLQIGTGGTTGVLNVSALTNNGALAFNRSDAFTYSGVLSGSGVVTKQGLGVLLLSGTNTYTGMTSISEGILAISSTAGLPGYGVNGRWSVAAGAGLTVGVNGLTNAAVDLLVTTATATDNLSSGAAIGFDATDTNTYTYANALPVSAGSGIGFAKSGAGTLQITGSSTYTGPTVIRGGSLLIGSGGTTGWIGATSDIVLSPDSVIRFNRTDDYGGFRPVISGSGGIVISSGTLAVATASSGYLDVGLSAGDAGTLNVTGGLVTSGSGNLGVGFGSVGTATVSSGTWANSSELVVGSSGTGTLNVTGGSVTNLDGHVGFEAGSVGTATVSSGTWANSNQLVVGLSGAGTLNVTGGSVTSDITFLGGYAGSVGTATVSSGTLANRYVLAVGSSGTGILNVNGGRVTNYTGQVGGRLGSVGTATVSSGTWANIGYLAVGMDGAGTLNVTGGSVTNLDGYVDSGPGSIGTATVSSGTWASSGDLVVGRYGAGTLNVTGGSVTNGSGSLGFEAGSIGTATVSGGTWANSRNLTVGDSGTGTLTMSGGLVTVGGTLSRGTNGTINLNAGGTLQIGTGGTTGVLATNLTNNGRLVFNRAGNSTYSGTISGNGSVTKQGSGTLTLAGANTYTDLTWVREGTLAMGVSNAFAAASDLTVDSGATFDRAGFAQTVIDAVINGTVASTGGGLLTVTGTLSGSGVVNGNVSVAGIHAPGNSPGTQTFFGDLTYSAGAAVNWELVANTTGSAGTFSDQILLPTGNLAFSGSTSLNLSFNAAGSTVAWSNPFWAVDRSWLVYDLSAGTTTGIGNFSVSAADWLDANAATLSSARPGSTFSIGLTGQDVVLNYVAAVPEPGSLALLATAGAIGLGLRRRRAPIGRVSAILVTLAGVSSGPAHAAVTTYTSTFSGTIAAGDTALLTGTASVSGNVANSGTLQFNITGSSAVANNAIISGTGLVRMTGSGTVSNLFDAQTYTGATRLENGTLLVNYNDRLGNTSSGVTFDGGRLQITNSGVVSTFSTARSMSLVSAGTIDTSTLANGSYDQPAFTGPISGGGTLTLAANGLGNGASDAYLRLGGTSTYSGTTRITSGMVYASSTAAFGTSTVVLDGGGLVAPNAVTVNNAIVLAGTANVVRPWTGDTMNLGGVISGTGGLQKTDNGTVTLNAANTYTGDTRIVAGTLNVANYAALATTTLDMNAADAGSIGFTVAQTGTYEIAGLTGSRAINNGGDTLAIGGNNVSTTYSGNLSGGGGLIKTGAGTLTLSAGNSFTGDTRISAGTLAIEHANGLQSSTLDMNSGDSGAITFSQASNIGGLTGSRGLDNGGYTLTIGGNDGNFSYAGTLSGTGGLIKNGSRSLGLTGSNSFSGDTRISAGTLVIANSNALANSMLDMNSGDSGVITFALASNIGGLKGSRAINNGGNTLTIGGLVTSTTYSGALSGGGALVKTGAGTLTLTGNNSYTGGTVLQGGTLAVGSANAIGSSGTISFTGGTLRYSAVGFPVDYSARLSSAAGQLYAIDTNGRDVSFATPLNSLGGSLTKLGEGKLTLPDSDVGVVGVENMSVLLVEGLLEGASGSSSLFIPGGQVLNVSGGVLGRVNNFDAVTIDRVVIGSSDVPGQPIATGTISGGLVYVNGIEVGSSQSGTSAGGSLTVNGGFVKTKVSVGMASGTSASMLLTGGTVGDAESDHIVGVSGVGSLTMTGGSLVGRFVSLGSAAGSQGDVIMSGGTVSSQTLVVGMNGTGVLNVSGGEVNTFLVVGQFSTGTVAISGGVVRATIRAGDFGGTTGTVVISGGTVGGSLNDHAIGDGGTGSLAMTGGSLIGRQLNLGDGGGAGTAGISSGTTTVDKLTVGSWGSGEMTLTNGRVDTRSTVIARAETGRSGAVTVSGGTLTASESMSVGGFRASGTLSVTDSGVVIVAGGTGTIDVGNIFGPSTVNIGTGAAVGTLAVGRVNGNGAFGAGAAVTFNHTGTATFTPAIVGTMNVTKLGTGTTILTGSNTYAGLTWVREGTLVVGAANAFSEATRLTMDLGATFDRAGFSQTVTNAAINGSLANTGGGGLLTVTGTLSGSGVVNGNVSVAGIHAPGNSPGTQTFTGDLTYSAGAAVNWELIANTTGSAGTLSDQIVLPTGNLAFSGSTALNLSFNAAGSTVNWSDPFWGVDRAWLVYDLSAGTTTGIDSFAVAPADWLDANAATLSSVRPGSTFSLGLAGQDVVLNYVAAVPEPGSLALLATAGAIGLGLRRRVTRPRERTTVIR